VYLICLAYYSHQSGQSHLNEVCNVTQSFITEIKY
jgi:hypothetical protein